MKKGIGFFSIIVLAIILVASSILLYASVRIMKLLGKSTQIDVDVVSSEFSLDTSLSWLMHSQIHELSFSPTSSLLYDYVKFTNNENPSCLFMSKTGEAYYMLGYYVPPKWFMVVNPRLSIWLRFSNTGWWFHMYRKYLLGRDRATTGNALYNSVGGVPDFYIVNSSGTWHVNLRKGDKELEKKDWDHILLGNWMSSCQSPGLPECPSDKKSCIGKVCFSLSRSQPPKTFVPIVSGRDLLLVGVEEI